MVQSRTINVNKHKYNTLNLKFSQADHARRNLKRKVDKLAEKNATLESENKRMASEMSDFALIGHMNGASESRGVIQKLTDENKRLREDMGIMAYALKTLLHASCGLTNGLPDAQKKADTAWRRYKNSIDDDMKRKDEANGLFPNQER